MPERRKHATQTTRQGQGRGQNIDPVLLRRVAAQHHVSVAWLRLVATGSLDDPAFVQAIREANERGLWEELVSPVALNALAPSGRQMQVTLPGYAPDALYGHQVARDAVLVLLLQALADAAHPVNRNFFSTRTPLQVVEEKITWMVADFLWREPVELRQQIEILRPDAERGRKQHPRKATKARRSKADDQATKWNERVDELVANGKSKGQAYLSVANADKLKNADVVENSIRNWKKRQKRGNRH
jgi:uncharacterized protein YoaH (UPF0181 family)